MARPTDDDLDDTSTDDEAARASNEHGRGLGPGTRAARAELRAWLRHAARLPEARLDELLRILEENWVDDVEGLRATIGALQGRLPAVAHRAIAQAIRAEAAS